MLAAVLPTAGAADCVGVVANKAFKPGDFERCAAITVGDASRGVRVHVFWTISGRRTKDEEITLAAQFPSDRGWVAIGLSESGSMYGSDIFVVRKPTGGIAVAEVSVSSLALTQTHTHIHTLTHTHTNNTHTHKHIHKHTQTPTHTHTLPVLGSTHSSACGAIDAAGTATFNCISSYKLQFPCKCVWLCVSA